MDTDNNEISNKVTLEPINIKKTIKKRCFHCNKKSMIVTMCKCENYFCLKHNQPEEHNCSFNFKLNKVMLEPIQFKKVEII